MMKGIQMATLRYYLLCNAMLAGNIIANIIGRVAAKVLGTSMAGEFLNGLAHSIDIISLSFLLLVTVLVYLYELPIRNALKAIKRQIPLLPADLQKARRRLLNEPYFVIAVDLLTWFMGTLFLGALGIQVAELSTIRPLVVGSLVTGLITATLALFWFDHIIQRRMAPILFPEGKLHATQGTLRIRIGTRLAALMFACSFVPLGSIHLTVHDPERAFKVDHRPPQAVLEKVQEVLLAETIVFALLAVGLTYLVAVDFTRSLKKITVVLNDVKKGVFSRKVEVNTNDELGYTGDVINEMTEGLLERDFIKETFGKYLAKEVRDEVLAGRVSFDGEMKYVTILFSDLRDFTPLTESNDPKLVVKIMNRYFKEMSEAIQDQGGLVLQFIGDEIYAVFGAPVPQPEHPERAFRAGLDMNRRLDILSREFEERGWPILRHGIGIHTGEALAANIGSPDRLSYLLIGDTVNVASRLQSLTKEFGVRMIISTATHAHLHETELKSTTLKKLPPVHVKGRNTAVEAFVVA
jgi:adenylate cyclase